MEESYTLESVRTSAVGKSLSKEELERFHAGFEEERRIPTTDGETHIYFYAPSKEGCYTTVINLHGGGFVKGHRDQDTVFCRNLVEHGNVCVVDIDYHTAPEKMYPYALNECYDVVKYVVAHPKEYCTDPDKIVLMGHSAGGNLIFGMEFLAQSEGCFQPALLIADYPPLDFTADPEEARFAYAPDNRVPVEKARMYNSWYIDKKYVREITASPVYAVKEELKNFPPVVMILAERDTLSVDGVKMAAKLIDAGVTVYAKRVPGSAHGFTVQRRTGYEIAEAIIFEALKKVQNQSWV